MRGARDGKRIDAGQVTPGADATFALLDHAQGEVAGPWVDVRGARALSLGREAARL